MATTEELYAAFPPTRAGRGAPSMFPRKLFQILTVSDTNVIAWDEDGVSFHIADYKKFVEETMPRFYRHNKLTSFQRQLNLYGFKKRGRGEPNPGHYYHPSFQRDRPELLDNVRRTYPNGIKGDGGESSPDEEIPSSNSTSQRPSHRHRRTNSRNIDNHRPIGLPIFPHDSKPPQGQGPGSVGQAGGGISRGGDSEGGGEYAASEYDERGTLNHRPPHDNPEQDRYEQKRVKKPCIRERAPSVGDSIREHLTRDKPQRPWFFSGNSARTDAVVRQEVTARRSGSNSAATSRGAFQRYTREKSEAFPGGVGGNGREGGGGGDRSCGGGGGGGYAAGRGGHHDRAGGPGRWTRREREGEYRSEPVEYPIFSRYTSRNGGYAAAWNENPRVADVLNRGRRTDRTDEIGHTRSDSSSNDLSGEHKQRSPTSRRETVFPYPVLDHQSDPYDSNHDGNVRSSTVFPYSMIRRSNFFRSSESELDPRFRAPPPSTLNYLPAASIKEEISVEHDDREVEGHAVAPTTAAAAAAAGWRPVWNERRESRHDSGERPRNGRERWDDHRDERSHSNRHGSERYWDGAREKYRGDGAPRRGRLPGARAAEHFEGGYRREEHGVEHDRVAAEEAVGERGKQIDLPRRAMPAAPYNQWAPRDDVPHDNRAWSRPARTAPREHDDMMILAAVARRDASASATGATGARSSPVATPPPAAPTIPREPSERVEARGHERSQTRVVREHGSGVSSSGASMSSYNGDSYARASDCRDKRDGFRIARKGRNGDVDGGEGLKGGGQEREDGFAAGDPDKNGHDKDQHDAGPTAEFKKSSSVESSDHVRDLGRA